MISSRLLDRETGARLRLSNLYGYGFHQHPMAPSHQSESFERWLLERIPGNITQAPFPVGVLKSFDKIFASTWLSPTSVVTGSKDNKLAVWDLSYATPQYKLIPLPPGSNTPVSENCGLHSVAKNLSQTLLVTGAENPCDLAVYSLPDFKLLAVLVGHSDWSFASDFLSDTRVVSVSRDKHFAVWSLDVDDLDSRSPACSRGNKHFDGAVQAHEQKIRDLKSGRNSNTFSTLSADASVKLWDSNSFNEIIRIKSEDERELVCMDYDDIQRLVAVGSYEGVTVYDTRSGDAAIAISANDADWGVRSVNLRQHLLTSGGGFGSVGFFDMRKGNTADGFIRLSHYSDDEYMECSRGFLDTQSQFYMTYYCDSTDPYAPAVYTVQWDPYGTRLFVAGGPIMLGLKGCYAALL